MNHHAKRIRELRRLAQLAPRDTELHFQLAQELANHDQFQEAAAELQVVIELAPNHLEARKLLDRAANQPPPLRR